MPRLTYPTAIVLRSIALGYLHGFDIIEASGLPSGTVYPILRRLEDAALLKSRWESTERARAEQRPPRRTYTLTRAGDAVLDVALAKFPGLARVVSRANARPSTA
jgi:DNA-binding PadR family transcriptional regulator